MRVGIVGGGQLGRMLSLAGHRLGITCITLDPAADSPAAQVGPAIVGAYDDEGSLTALAAASDVATFEFENVPVESMRFLADRVPVHPPSEALAAAQDRLAEKELFVEAGADVAPFVAVDDIEGVRRALGEVGTPAVVKSRRLGYDGKGQAPIHEASGADEAWRAIGAVPSIVEAHVSFDRELSIIGARDRDGHSHFYPLVENEHAGGILRQSRAPAPRLSLELQEHAERLAREISERLRYVGVIAIELFQRGDHLVVNEMAPRVHNSAHWTIEGAETSQFENHLRAVVGLPLGPTGARGYAGMVNVIGEEPDLNALLTAVPDVHVHRYGKSARPGRKLGHITVLADDAESLDQKLLQVRSFSPDVSPT